jgi:hypothetical protein
MKSPTSSESEYKYTITFINNTDYTLTVSDNTFNDFETFQIHSGKTLIIKSKSSFVLFDITHPSTSKVIDYEYINDNKVRFYQYNYTVQYKITGTANTVDVTLNNSSGGTEQYSNVSLPKTYSYKYFEDWFLYISAQNQGQSGTVTTSIYYKDNLFKTSTSSGAYVIATASGSKP